MLVRIYKQRIAAKLRKYCYLAEYRLCRLNSRVKTSRRLSWLAKRHYIGAACLLVATVLLLSWVVDPKVKAATLNFTANDMMNGVSDYNQTQLGSGNTTLSLQRGDIGAWHDYDNTQLPPVKAYGNSTLVYGPNDQLYMLTYISGCRLLRYAVETQQWEELPSPPVGCGKGSQLLFDGATTMYYLPGNNSTKLFKFSIETSAWTPLAEMDMPVGQDAAATYVSSGSNSAIFVTRGASSTSFWQYSIQNNTWTSKTPFPNTKAVDWGIDLVWDKSNYVYALSNHYAEFKRYSIATNSWSNVTAPANMSYIRNKMIWINDSIYSVQLRTSGTPRDSSLVAKYTPSTDSWQTLPQPPVGQYYDFNPAAAYDGSDTIYALFGSFERPSIYQYSISQQKWMTNSLFKLQDGVFSHWEMIYDNGHYAYYIGGTSWGNMDHLYRMDLDTKEVTQIGGQFLSTSGIAGVYYNNAIYTVPWLGGTSFQKYDLVTNNWVTLTAMPAASNWGSSIIDGGDGYLYATFGNQRLFYRYSEAAGWVRLADMPQTIAYDGTITRVGRTIYALISNSNGYFLKYNMDTNAWSSAPDAPNGSLTYGTWLASDGNRYVYAGLGTRTDPQNKMAYQYDTTNSTWKRIANTPQDTQIGASAFYDTNNNRLYVAQGTYHGRLWYWTPSSDTYVRNGTWYSKTTDTKHVKDWQSLTANVTGSGTVKIYTRTSANGNIWSDWQEVSGTTVNSPKKRYLQIKISLSGNGTTTPVVSNISVDYAQDDTPPNLPSQFSAKGSKDGEALTSGQTYAHQHPYFSWSGATDDSTGSGVAGYYVYFGSDSNADPQIDGNYQTTTDYTVTTAMTAGSVYYLRIKVKDDIGNVGDAATYFSYRYWYISPPGSVLASEKSDFDRGTNVGVNISDVGTMSLVQQAKGAWATGTMQTLPNTTYGPAMAVVGDFLYILRGSSTADFWRYNLVTQTWDILPNIPATVTIGSSVAWDGGGYLYAIRGGNSNGFYRYDIQNNVWETLPVLPAFAQSGADIKYIGDNRIAIFFSSVSEFYFYHTDSQTFEGRTSSPLTTSSNAGAGIWYDGNDTLYVYHGPYDMWQLNRRSLQAYSISQDVWRPLAQAPSEAWYGENNLVGDGNGHLYVFANDYVMNNSHQSMAMSYDIATDTWKTLPNAKGIDVRGTAAGDGKRYIYEIPSLGTSRRIIRYDTWDDRFTPQDVSISSWQRLPWDDQSSWPWQAGQATTAVYDGTDNVYAIGANEGNWARFVKYSVSTGDTKYLAPPANVGIGGSLAYSDGTLYYMPAKSLNYMYKFDSVNESWVRLSDIPATVYRPGANSLLSVGSDLYAVVGNNGKLLYKYSPAGNSWAKMTDAPGNILLGAAAYDGTRYIYVLAGNGSRTYYRYDTVANSWSTMAAMPLGAYNGTAMMYKNGKIYATSGNSTTNSYIYNVAANSWDVGVATPDTFRYGGVFVPINDQYALAMPGQDSPDVWRFNFPAANSAYSGLATHVSQPVTAEGIYDYAGIKAQVSLPANTKIEFWTRSSADGVNWDDWAISDQAKYYSGQMTTRVASKPQKFTQIKAIMYSFDNQSTPVIDSYALDYYYDTTPPSNPTLATVYSDSGQSKMLSSNVWYNYNKPHIDWPEPGEVGGATDGPLGSNIKGYWVYFGKDETAQPQTAGTFVSASDYSPELTEAGSYYLRLQAVDITGNVDSNVFAPFVYKFDNVPPTAPALITVTPSGFTSQNKYTFQWPNAFDGDSEVDKYCYHTGDLSGPLSIENCQDGVELTDIDAAYKPGTNIFYLRTLDKAGNYSANYTTVSYYFSTDPPSPVTNLRAVPPVSAQNLFAFTWDYPSLFAGDPDQLSYCYSINELPAPTNTTCAPDKFIGAFKAATQQGTNILYMVAKDEAGNVNWNSYATANFIANTVSPGIPLNLVVNDTSDRISNRWALTLTWDKPTFEGNGVASYVIERSEDNHTFTEIGQVSNTAYVDLTVLPEVRYYYRVRAADNVDNRGGPSAIVAQSAKGSFVSPPQIVSEPKVQSSFDQATVGWVTARAATSFVYYGTNPTQLSQSKGALDIVSEHGVTITGLQPSTNYYYKVQSFDNDRSYDLATAFSQLYTFRTSANARIFNVKATDVGLDSAVMNWQTSVGTKARIQYGPTTDYGFTQEDVAGYTGNHLQRLTSLESGTTYHYRITAITEQGSQVMSDDYTLSTIARPVISDIQFQPMPDSLSIAVKVSWKTNVPTSSDVNYRALGTKQQSSQADLVTDHEMVIGDLAGSTDYEFDIQGRDQYGNLATSDNQKWHSTVDTRPPSLSDLSVNVTTMEAVGNSKAQMIISWKTDEPSTTQVFYGETGKKLSKKSAFDPEPTVSHVVVISNLDLAKVYTVQPISRDLSGNTSYGAKLSTVTPDKEQSALDAVLNTLQRIFRF